MDTTRPLRVILKMKTEPLRNALSRYMKVTLEGYVLVESVEEADLVLITDVRDVDSYHTDKRYAYICVSGSVPDHLPKNCRVLNMLHLSELAEHMFEIRQQLALVSETSVVSAETVELLPNAMRILVIDDIGMHRDSARRDLAGHNLTVVDGYQSAMETLKQERFDVVLTDLHLPMSSQMMGDKFRPDELVPYGLLLRDEAALRGAKYVAVVTDLSHHDDPFSAAFDHFSRRPIHIESAVVVMLHAQLHKNGGKDWAHALKMLVGE